MTATTNLIGFGKLYLAGPVHPIHKRAPNVMQKFEDNIGNENNEERIDTNSKMWKEALTGDVLLVFNQMMVFNKVAIFKMMLFNKMVIFNWKGCKQTPGLCKQSFGGGKKNCKKQCKNASN